jgi:predicted polyphosphate/ATP-dependent NAD kinase
MRMLACGGRDYSDRHRVYEFLDAWHAEEPITILIAGGANGADALAVDWARYRKVLYRVFAADWEMHGRAAGPIRNQRMIDEGKPDAVVVFPGGRGTADMILRANKAKLPVHYAVVEQPGGQVEDGSR